MSTTNTASGVAYMNKNFDAWRDSVMTIAVTLDDNGASVTAFRLDIIFDNDLFKMANSAGTGDSTRVEKGSYLSNWVEGDDDSTGTDYSYEVVRYANVGYVDSLQTEFNEGEITSEFRTISIPIKNGDEKIQIIGTHVIPEFGTIIQIVLVVAIITTIIFTRTKLSITS